jgi:hypothetical protein
MRRRQDPQTRSLTTETARDTVFRGYHNLVALTADGSLLVGGGFNYLGDVGCENPHVRIFRPSYLSRGARPEFASGARPARCVSVQAAVLTMRVCCVPGAPEVVQLLPGGTYVLPPLATDSAALHSTRGVALLAVQDFTHSYCQNQRYVVLPFTRINATTVSVTVPAEPVVMAGQYHLFLLSDAGVPSHALHAVVPQPPAPSRAANGTPAWVIVVLPLVALALLCGTAFYCHRRRRELLGSTDVLDQPLYSELASDREAESVTRDSVTDDML